MSDASQLAPPSEKRGFSLAEMVKCDKCLRANAPTRTNCMYCLAVLPTSEETAALRRPTLRRLEEWEQGYNNILVSRGAGELPEKSLAEIAVLLRLEPAIVKRIFALDKPLPLARASAFEEAAVIEKRLQALAVETLIVPDADLGAENLPPKRIRGLAFQDDALLGRESDSGAPPSIPWADVYLILSGRLVLTKIEVEEKKSRGGGERELVDSRELSDDEPVVDIYTRTHDGGWRIAAKGFDFSCLGDRKRMLAAENYFLLLEVLRERSPAAEFDDSYVRLRQPLTAVWPLVQQTEGRGWRRARPGKYNIGAVTTTNNEMQFTRYSRLRHNLKLRGL